MVPQYVYLVLRLRTCEKVKCIPHGASVLGRPAKIADFDIIFAVEQNILRLQISMQHPIFMQVVNCQTRLKARSGAGDALMKSEFHAFGQELKLRSGSVANTGTGPQI